MIYGKLLIVLLSTLASQADDTTECRIASYVLNHAGDAAQMNIAQVAQSCHLSVSSISRFCRSIGLDDFAELRALVSGWDRRFIPDSVKPQPSGRMCDTLDAIGEGLDRLKRSLDPREIEILCRKLDGYDCVYLLGLLKAGMAAQCLQADLLLLGKKTVCKVAFAQQLECMEKATKRDIVIIFSYSGIYFDYLSGRIPQGLHRAHVVFITGAKTPPALSCVDQLITFDSALDQASHPFQMQAISRLIAQEYAHQHGKNE